VKIPRSVRLSVEGSGRAPVAVSMAMFANGPAMQGFADVFERTAA